MIIPASTPITAELHASRSLNRCLTGELAALRAELRDACERAAHLDARLVSLQGANEAAYKALYGATGGPRFDKAQPFGTVPAPDSAVHTHPEADPWA